MQNTFIGLLLAVGVVSTGCASNRGQAVTLGVLGAGAMVGGGVLFDDANHCEDCQIGTVFPNPGETTAGSVLFVAGALALGYATYQLIVKDKAWLDAEPGDEPVASEAASRRAR